MVVVESCHSLTLVLGPARSGKSRWAEHLAIQSGLPVTYLATGPQPTADDATWLARVEAHVVRRPPHWGFLEVDSALAAALDTLSPPGLALVDSLGTWVAAGLDLDSSAWQQRCTELLESLRNCRVTVLLVSEQTGWGVVPATAIGGLFRDRLGSLEQQLAPFCGAIWLVVAGRALNLTNLGLAIPAT
ncbi:MAG: bifunctional adenosylcobinamide kinase/adenosylcobinamide-phosphate guanylyltransferase [Cyanobacteria bacterium]|nr:bifunctional adenosylcobinamide kinase/adenosylcobinamide-phosphate guanylyltransferase [Cyanobacteriota bacterium]MDA1246144.1 bifunctional adenosylcobinamide kinase/adenosylcobinamide-phosphate guanylyltransferase [Cyanobacteriota bacterium]